KGQGVSLDLTRSQQQETAGGRSRDPADAGPGRLGCNDGESQAADSDGDARGLRVALADRLLCGGERGADLDPCGRSREGPVVLAPHQCRGGRCGPVQSGRPQPRRGQAERGAGAQGTGDGDVTINGSHPELLTSSDSLMARGSRAARVNVNTVDQDL